MYRKTVLQNGVRILSEKLEHFRSVSLGIWVDVGSRDEMEQENGISHFIEHMIFKRTRTRNSLQIAKELDAIGGLSNAFTGKESTCFHSKVLDKHFLNLGEILSDLFLNSIFRPQDVDLERQVIFQEISMVEDTPDDHIYVLFNRLFWIDHPLGMPVLGTGETVTSINKETIFGYMKRFYTPERIIIAAAGHIDHETLLSFFQPLFEPLESGGKMAPRRIPKINSDLSCHYKDLEQIHVCLGGKAPKMSSDLRFASAIFNTILGGNMSSRLSQEIREKRGLAYSVYSFLSSYMDTGLLGVYVATDPLQLNQVLGLINKEIKKIQKGGLSKPDLAGAKEHLTGGIILGSENTDGRMMRLAKNEYILKRHMGYEELIGKLEKVTVDDVIQVAKDTFKSDEITLVTLGPARQEDLDLDCLQFH